MGRVIALSRPVMAEVAGPFAPERARNCAHHVPMNVRLNTEARVATGLRQSGVRI